MTFDEMTNLTASVFQFVVAGYALRLNRILETVRVGLSLSCDVGLPALFPLIQSRHNSKPRLNSWRLATGGRAALLFNNNPLAC